MFATLKSFVKRVHNEFETTIKSLRSDNGSEFKNTRIDEFGIKHKFSAKYTPQSKGLIERKNRTLIDMARSMLSEYNVSHSFGLRQSTPYGTLLSPNVGEDTI